MNNQIKEANKGFELLTIGLILMLSNVSFYFLFGIIIRYAALLFGILLIFYAAWKRGKPYITKSVPLFLLFGIYFALLGILSFLQGHAISYDYKKQIFSLIAFGCFCSGYLLAISKTVYIENFKSWKVRVFTVITIFSMIGFIQYYESISFHGTARGYGADTALNPVGIAFLYTSLLLVFFTLTILSRNVIDKILYSIAILTSAGVIVTTASRGALIWAFCTILFYFTSQREKYFKFKNFFLVLIFGAIIIFSGAIIFSNNVILGESIEILIKRFTSLLDVFNNSKVSQSDLSANARLYYWEYYFKNFSDWILFGEKNYVGYPHNQYLEILVRFGLLGIPLLLFSFYIIITLIKKFTRKLSAYDIELSMILVIFLFSYLSSLSSLSLEVNRGLWLGLGYFAGYFNFANLK